MSSLPDQGENGFRVLTTWLHNHRFRIYAFLLILVLMIFRAPDLILGPRFWGEEGNIYFRQCWRESLPRSLLFVYPTAGYFSLITNLVCIVASRLAPIEAAPTVTTFFSLAYQMIPFVFVLWGRAMLWQGTLAKVLACALLLFVSTSGYVWLNTINLQSWCGLVSFCILMEPLAGLSRMRMAGLVSLLVINCLTGAYSLFLFPVFLFKFFFERSPSNLWLVVSMIVCAAFQAGAVSASLGKLNTKRHSPGQITLYKPAERALVNHMIEPVVGELNKDVHRRIMPKAGQSIFRNLLPTLLYIGFFMLLLPWTRNSEAWLPPLAWLCSSAFTTILAFDFLPIGRYAAFPGFLFVLLLVSRLDFDWRRETRGLLHKAQTVMCLCLIACSLIFGLISWRRHDYLAYDAMSPYWPTEIKHWQEDPEYRPKIWPYKKRQWEIFYLTPHKE